MQGEAKSIAQNTSLDNLLSRLDEQVSTYYSLLNDLGNVTHNIQEDSPTPVSNDVKGCDPLPYNPGKLYRFNELLSTFSNHNSRLASELKKLQQHV